MCLQVARRNQCHAAYAFPPYENSLWRWNSCRAQRGKNGHTILFQKKVWSRQKNVCGSWQHLMLKAKTSRAVKSEEVYWLLFRTAYIRDDKSTYFNITIWKGLFMETLKTIWDFFQNEVLGMNWLNRLIETFLNACGLDTTGKIGGSVQFFIYDTVKIMVLLGVLILIISYIQSYFPP